MRTILFYTSLVLPLVRPVASNNGNSLGVAGAGATENGYDTGTSNPICWSGVSASDANESTIPFENPLVSNFRLQQQLEVASRCPNGIDLRVIAPSVEFETPRTETLYSYTVTGSVDVDSLLPSDTTVTNDLGTSEIGIQVILCKLENLGFCSPLVHNESTIPSFGQIHDDTHVDSEFVLVSLQQDNFFTVQVPIRVDQEGGYSVVASMLLFRKQENNSTVYTSLVANMPNATEDRVVYFKEEPEILAVSRSARITAICLSSLCGLFLLFLLGHLLKYRQNQVLKLTQGNFLSCMLLAAAIATCFSFSFEPTRVNCHLTGPFVILPIHLVYAVNAGRLWRINSVLSPLLLITLDKDKDTLNQRLVRWIQFMVTCSRRTNIRRHITDLQLAKVIGLFTLPQILVQIAIAIVQPNSLTLELNSDETVGAYQCGDPGLFRSALEAVSLAFLVVMMVIVLIMAGSSRDLPSLFNETKLLFDVTLLSAVILAIASIVVVVSDSTSTSPDVAFLVCVFAVSALTVTTSVKIVMPKLQKVWSGEVVFVSKLIADHNNQRKSSVYDSSVPMSSNPNAIYKQDGKQEKTEDGEAATDKESSIEFFNKQKSVENLEQKDEHTLTDNDLETDDDGQHPAQTTPTRQLLKNLSIPKLHRNDLDSTVEEETHHDEPTMTERVSAELQTPGQHVFKVSEDQPPSRQLLLLMVDLQQLLTTVNKNILCGATVEQTEWERVRHCTSTLGAVFRQNVLFAWEEDRDLLCDEDRFDTEAETRRLLDENEDGLILSHTPGGALSTVFDESNSKYSSSTRGSRTTQQLLDIAVALRKNVQVRDRQYRLVKYRNCFVASEAVDFLVSSRIAASRTEAVTLGRRLARALNLFEHVTNDHEFTDDYLFFRFVGISSFGNSALTNALGEMSEDFSAGQSSDGRGVVSLASGWRNDESRLDQNLAKVAVAVRNNVEVKDRRYRMVVYKQCFVANEAVDYLVRSSIAQTRQEAVEIGLMLAEKYKIFEHVCNEHNFEDGYLFFRFVDASTRDNELDMTIHSVDKDGNSSSVVSNLDSDIGSMFSSNTKSPWKTMTDDALEGLAVTFKNSVQIEDRKYHGRVYKQCFIGSEAVDYFVGAGYAYSRRDAVQLGRHLAAKLDLFDHVTGDHKLKDGYFFFRFNAQHNACLPSAVESSTNSRISGKHGEDSGSIADSKVSQSSQQHWSQLSDEGLGKIALAMRSGVSVKDRRYHLVLFRKCFVGRQAVDFLINSGLAISRKDASHLASTLMTKFALFEHVTREHDFTDGYRFYRFLEGNIVYKAAVRSLRRGEDNTSHPSSVSTADQVVSRRFSLPVTQSKVANDMLPADATDGNPRDDSNIGLSTDKDDTARNPGGVTALGESNLDRRIQTITEGDAAAENQKAGDRDFAGSVSDRNRNSFGSSDTEASDPDVQRLLEFAKQDSQIKRDKLRALRHGSWDDQLEPGEGTADGIVLVDRENHTTDRVGDSHQSDDEVGDLLDMTIGRISERTLENESGGELDLEAAESGP